MRSNGDSGGTAGRRRRRRRGGGRDGFSLLEIMLVFVLIGVLATLVTVNARAYLIKGKQSAARAEIAAICSALDTFYTLEGRYPDNDEGLAILATRSDRVPEPLLKQRPKDPWGNDYQYNRPGPDGQPYEVISFGADGRDAGSGGDADLHSWDPREAGR